jgi:phospholipid/cholesterol/gamma-HCH transport system substrate-binding protein
MRVDYQRQLFGGGALAVALIAVLWVLFSGGSTYVVNARFLDAGQLVGGDLVTVAGHPVGSVGAISLTDNGQANVQLNITDPSITPLQNTTIATIGQLSLTGVTNRFVSLAPGVGGQQVPNDGTLPTTQTKGIVDLDVLLDALTPQVRNSLAKILKTGAYFIHSPTGADLNQFALYLNPALSQLTNLGAEIVSDKYALGRLVASTSNVAGALARNSNQLAGSVTETANVLNEVAGERSALQGVLVKAPGVLGQSDTVLAHVDSTLKHVAPAIVALNPLAPKLAALLRLAVPFTAALVPTVAGLGSILPAAKTALAAFDPIGRLADPALLVTARAIAQLTPVAAGSRPYIADLIAGFFAGVGGSTGGMYDANGHFEYSRAVGSGEGSLFDGLLSKLGIQIGQYSTPAGKFGTTAACPGGAISSADGTSPWTNPHEVAGEGTLCNPADDQP